VTAAVPVPIALTTGIVSASGGRSSIARSTSPPSRWRCRSSPSHHRRACVFAVKLQWLSALSNAADVSTPTLRTYAMPVLTLCFGHRADA
jgi:peptide/nickel transport system permease protein